MPILSMLETIFYKLLQRIQAKQKEADTWPGPICPKIQKKLDKMTEWSKNYFVIHAGGGVYKVSYGDMDKGYVVDMKGKTCDCRRWQLSGIPCPHALACCREDRIQPESLVHSCYNIATFRQAYAFSLSPLRGRDFWEKMNGVEVHPPLFTKVMGRQKKTERKLQKRS